MINKKIQKNNDYLKKLQQNSGFVLLFAVTLVAIFLSIALGVGQIALKENQFSTSAVDTNNAFFAADTGAEQVLYNDFTSSIYPAPDISTLGATSSYSSPYYFSNLGGLGLSCAIVTITKTTKQNLDLSLYTATSVNSNGYNIGGGSSGMCSKPSNVVERDLTTTY